jgi:parallel beta-helix repeat protein
LTRNAAEHIISGTIEPEAGIPAEKGESEMTRRMAVWFASLLALFTYTGSAHATDISGAIATTLTLSADSKLVGDVTCTVSGAACIALGASGVTLDLNGFSITGLGDSETGCSGMQVAGEFGIDVNAQKDVVIRGPGLIQRFRFEGIRILGSTGVTVTGVTVSTNCRSGIFVSGGSENLVENNVSVRNGNLNNPCGGI